MATGPRYRVEFAHPAVKQFRDLPRQEQLRIAPAIDALAEDPRPRGSEKIKGEEDQYRIRVGSYRVIYAIRDDRLIVLVVRIGHRRDIYRKKSPIGPRAASAGDGDMHSLQLCNFIPRNGPAEPCEWTAFG